MEKKLRKLIIATAAVTGAFMPTAGVFAMDNQETAETEDTTDTVVMANMILEAGIGDNDFAAVHDAIVSYGADRNGCNKEGIPFLVLALSLNCSEEIINLLQQEEGGQEGNVVPFVENVAPHFVPEEDEEGKVTEEEELNASLFKAASEGNAVMARQLLDKKADVNARDDKENTPVMFAVRGSYNDVVGLLIRQRADVNTCNKDGMAPLDFAPGGRASARVVQQQVIAQNAINEQLALWEPFVKARQEEKNDTEESDARRSHGPQRGVVSTSKVCTVCTFVNDSRCTRCEMCNGRLK